MRSPRRTARVRRGAHRPVCALLALLLLLLSFTLPSCGKNPDPDGTEAPPNVSSEAGTSGSSLDLPSKDGPDGNRSALVYRAPEKTLAALPDYTPDGALIIAADSRCGGILGEHTLLGSSFDGVNAAIRERFGAETYFQSYAAEELFSKTRAAAAGTGDGESFFADLLRFPLSSRRNILPQICSCPSPSCRDFPLSLSMTQRTGRWTAFCFPKPGSWRSTDNASLCSAAAR